jgi:hypothetical protein
VTSTRPQDKSSSITSPVSHGIRQLSNCFILGLECSGTQAPKWRLVLGLLLRLGVKICFVFSLCLVSSLLLTEYPSEENKSNAT